MADELAAALSNPSPSPESSPTAPAAEPSRLDTIREAVEAQKAKGAVTDETIPDAPAKAAPKAPASPTERARDLTGKFAPATDKPAPDRVAAPAATAPASPAAPVADPNAPAPAPEDAPRAPPGWSPASKVAFDALPDSVKADIAKREREVNQGFAKLAELKPVEKYLEMAKRGGTTLDRALEQYTGIENLLKRDVFAGFEQIAKNTGINLRSFAMAYLQRSGGGDQNPGAPTDPAAHQPAAIDPQTIVRQATEAVRAEYEARQVQSEVQKFAADPKNRFYENVKPKMFQLVQAGIATTIQDAYDQACQLDPEIRRIINTPPAPDPRIAAAQRAREQGRATVGAPSPGAVSGKAASANGNRREVIEAAVAAQRGARA